MNKTTFTCVKYFAVTCNITLATSFFYESKNPVLTLTIIGIYGFILVGLLIADVKSFKIANVIEVEREKEKTKQKEIENDQQN